MSKRVKRVGTAEWWRAKHKENRDAKLRPLSVHPPMVWVQEAPNAWVHKEA